MANGLPDETEMTRTDSMRQVTTAIGRAVMEALGRPADFLRVMVRPVAGDSYRVNVVTGTDPASARVAHSFFVGADDAGNVIRSSPPLARHY